MPRSRFLISTLLALATLTLASAATAVAAPLKIVCTTGMITDAARRIAGDRAEVTGLMGAGVDPHLYKPTRADIARLTAADIVFYNGLLLEGKMTDALIRVAVAGRKVYAVTELVDEADLLEPAEFAGLFDPHLWMDPIAWAGVITVIRDKLSEIDPQNTTIYAANAAAYERDLADLAEYSRRVLATVPENRRMLVTAHDAFNYFGRRFGFEVVGIQGLSTESEAGVMDIERIVAMLVERSIPAVFAETTIATRNIEALIAGARARGHRVALGGRLFSDAMGAPGTYEGTYVGMIDHNVTAIARALGGEAPERGMTGRLAATAGAAP